MKTTLSRDSKTHEAIRKKIPSLAGLTTTEKLLLIRAFNAADYFSSLDSIAPSLTPRQDLMALIRIIDSLCTQVAKHETSLEIMKNSAESTMSLMLKASEKLAQARRTNASTTRRNGKASTKSGSSPLVGSDSPWPLVLRYSQKESRITNWPEVHQYGLTKVELDEMDIVYVD